MPGGGVGPGGQVRQDEEPSEGCGLLFSSLHGPSSQGPLRLWVVVSRGFTAWSMPTVVPPPCAPPALGLTC